MAHLLLLIRDHWCCIQMSRQLNIFLWYLFCRLYACYRASNLSSLVVPPPLAWRPAQLHPDVAQRQPATHSLLHSLGLFIVFI